MTKNFTCIVCPLGCSIDAEIEDNKILNIMGNGCPRGAEYVKAEITNPVRTITSTVKTADGRVVSVKTDAPVAKSKIFECMKEINNVEIDLKTKPGDVIIKNVAGSGANILATSSL